MNCRCLAVKWEARIEISELRWALPLNESLCAMYNDRITVFEVGR